VEEGAEVRAEEPPLPPPPTKASFQNAVPNYSSNGPVGGGDAANGFADVKTSNAPELSSGMPPMPPTQNQFSARGRMGVRSR
jgi:COPII coat assembly protein SEC16